MKRVRIDSDDLKHLAIGTRVTIDASTPKASEPFIITQWGQHTLFVSMDYGYAYTRPQFVEKYGIIASQVLISEPCIA